MKRRYLYFSWFFNSISILTILYVIIKEAQNFFENKEHYLHYEVEFDIKNNSLDYFDIVFEKPLKGCKIPPIHYKKQIEERIW